MKNISPSKIVGACALLLLVGATARADTLSWASPGTSGTWATPANWYDSTTDATSTYYPLYTTDDTDDVTLGTGDSAYTVTLSAQAGMNTLTIESGVTLDFVISGANRIYFTNGLTNAGTIEATGVGTAGPQLASNSTGYAAVITNTGTIEAVGTSLVLGGAIVTNTGGTLAALSGGKLDFNGPASITGGTLNIDATSTATNGNIQGTQTFTNLVVTNAGQFNFTQVTGSGSRAKALNITDGSFDNSGTFTLTQYGNGTVGTAIVRNLSTTISGNNVFTNSGTVTVQNISADPSSDSEYAALTVNDGIAGSFNNTGTIDINDSATGTAASAAYAQYASMTVADGSKFTNTGTINVSLGAGVTDDTSHYATLAISTAWNNTGTLIVNSAGKTQATASVNLGANAYTQSGSTSVTSLIGGGLLIAGTVSINGGTLEGVGRVLAATTIASGATLAPGAGTGGTGTLTFTSLTLNSGSNLNFDLGTSSDLLAITGDLTLAGLLNITAGTGFGAGTYTLATYGGSLSYTALTIDSAPDGYTYAIDTSTSGEVLLDVAAIPEPATTALIAGGAALCCFVLRRRRR